MRKDSSTWGAKSSWSTGKRSFHLQDAMPILRQWNDIPRNWNRLGDLYFRRNRAMISSKWTPDFGQKDQLFRPNRPPFQPHRPPFRLNRPNFRPHRPLISAKHLHVLPEIVKKKNSFSFFPTPKASFILSADHRRGVERSEKVFPFPPLKLWRRNLMTITSSGAPPPPPTRTPRRRSR